MTILAIRGRTMSDEISAALVSHNRHIDYFFRF